MVLHLLLLASAALQAQAQAQAPAPASAPAPADAPTLPPLGALVVTLQLAPDGTITGCSAESRGAFPKVGGDAQCRQSVNRLSQAYLDEQARLYRTLRVGIGFEKDKDLTDVLPATSGTLLFRRASEVTVTAEGAPLSCRGLASVGPEVLHADACPMVEREVAARPAGTSPGPAAHRVIVDFAIQGISR